MLASEAEYDVYNFPRIGPVQFGDYVAGEGKEREGLLQSAKYFYRTHRARAWLAKQQVTAYLTSPARNIGDLDAALDQAKAERDNTTLSDQRRADADASAESLGGFIGGLNNLKIVGKDIIAIDEKQNPMMLEGLCIPLDLICLVSSVSKTNIQRIGSILLNTQVGKGLGTKADTVARRKKAGETVALLVLRQVIDRYSDKGEPWPEDCMHIYARAKHIWSAPKSYTIKLGNIEAEARSIVKTWDTIEPPPDFDPKKARFFDKPE